MRTDKGRDRHNSRSLAIAKASPMIAAFLAALAPPAAALAHDTRLGWRSSHVFQPHHPWKDGEILIPTRNGPVPVHVRIYSTPHEPPYYNVPPYIVLDP